MNRAEWETYILETYQAEGDFPWARYPDYEVFRHGSNQKWFALVMEIPREKLGLPGDGNLAVMNLKCGPALVGALRSETGFFPAYHMSKDSWITAALDGTVADDQLKALLDVSYDLTKPKKKR